MSPTRRDVIKTSARRSSSGSDLIAISSRTRPGRVWSPIQGVPNRVREANAWLHDAYVRFTRSTNSGVTQAAASVAGAERRELRRDGGRARGGAAGRRWRARRRRRRPKRRGRLRRPLIHAHV